jgi:hypothetical protein
MDSRLPIRTSMANRNTSSISPSRIDGGQGSDTVTYRGSRLQYSVVEVSGNHQIVTAAASGAADTLFNVQHLRFSDSAPLDRRPR